MILDHIAEFKNRFFVQVTVADGRAALAVIDTLRDAVGNDDVGACQQLAFQFLLAVVIRSHGRDVCAFPDQVGSDQRCFCGCRGYNQIALIDELVNRGSCCDSQSPGVDGLAFLKVADHLGHVVGIPSPHETAIAIDQNNTVWVET